MRLRPVTASIVIAFAATPIAGAAPGLGSQDKVVITGEAALTIETLGGFATTIDLRLIASPTAAPVARLAVYVPRGYTVKSPPPGTTIGYGFLFTVSTGDPGGSASPQFGSIKAVDPATVDPAAQACDPAPHAAVWVFSPEGANSATTAPVPMFVDTVGTDDPVGTSYRIQLCPTPAANARLETAGMLLRGSVLAAPSATGSYLWRAFVTPFGLGSTSADPSQTFELRALVPVPQTLSLDARYDRKTHRAVLSGQVTQLGRPKAGVEITFHAHSAHVRFADFGPARTDSRGRYSITWPISEKTDFTASIEAGEPGRCSTDPTPPAGGCASQTMSVPPDEQATVRLPKPTDPKLAITAADRRLAAGVSLRLSDFPDGWGTVPVSPGEALPCPDLQQDESKLTLTGSSYSPVFLNGSSLTEAPPQVAISVVKIWKTAADAKNAYAREAPAVQLRCILDDPKAKILKAGPLPSLHLGRASRAFRMIALDEDPDQPGKQHTNYFDLVEILGRRSLSTLIFFSTDTPPLLEKALSQAVGRRALRA